MPQIASTIEAILYLKGRPLTVSQIAEFARCDRDVAEEGLIDLMEDYAHRDSALEISETKDGYCLQLKEGFRHLVDVLIPLDLGVGALRTLAAIALKGPISQTDLVDLRGSGAYQHVPELVSLGFVRKRRQSDGRSFWLQVTNKFYQHFQIDQLPGVKKGTTAKPADQDSAAQDSAAQDSAAQDSAPETTTAPDDETEPDSADLNTDLELEP